MSESEIIAAIEKALAVDRRPNSSDRDFATNFLRAYRVMMEIRRDPASDDDDSRQQGD